VYDLFNGQDIQVNAYLFSTETVPTVEYNSSSTPANNPQYTGLVGFIAPVISWTHRIAITKRAACNIANPTLPDWFVTLGSSSIDASDFAIRADVSKSFDV
jgi:hypothetical protein